MNILFCYYCWMNPNTGGVQRVSDTLAKYFISKGHKLFYLTFENDEKDNYQFPAKIFHLPDSDFFSSININYYNNLLNQLSIDLVFNHDASNNRSKLWLNTGKHPARRISLYHQDPVYSLNRTSDLSGRLRVFLFKNFPGIIRYLKILKKKKEIEFLLKRSDRLVFLSDETKRQITNKLKISTSKIEAINNPCVFHNIEGLDIKKKQILFVGEMVLAPKRPDKMLKIWSNLQEKFTDWELIFLGDGSDRTKVEEMAKSMELKNVKFKGFVKPEPYYKEASVLCMTSDCEGFGLVLAEAMQFGVVPIAFNNWSAIKDIIINGKTGILVETDNIDEYCEKLSQLLSSEVYRNRISEDAKEYIKKFDIMEVGPQWLKLVQSLLITGK